MSDLANPRAKEVLARTTALVKRAEAGDNEALAITREIFDLVPDLWDAYGDLASAAEKALVDLYSGDNVLGRDALTRKLATVRAELAGPETSPLEQLLVERVVACWLQSYHADFAYARALKELPPDQVNPYERRQDRAARQYLKSLQSLATVRRLLVPMVQINVGERQVNVASPNLGSDTPVAVD